MTRNRFRAALVVLVMLGGVLAGTAPAQAVASYSEACPGFAHADSEPIWDSAGAVLGLVHVGVRTDVGRVCVATIKHRWAGQNSRTIARIDVHATNGTWLRAAWDDGVYGGYAGEPCTYGPPEFEPGERDCSTRHARDLIVRIEGDMSPPGAPGTRYQAVFSTSWAYLAGRAR